MSALYAALTARVAIVTPSLLARPHHAGMDKTTFIRIAGGAACLALLSLAVFAARLIRLAAVNPEFAAVLARIVAFPG